MADGSVEFLMFVLFVTFVVPISAASQNASGRRCGFESCPGFVGLMSDGRTENVG